MEVVRDKRDNCIIVCSIENLDPMGVHTGNSITVAPALTLTDKEYQIMRDASIAVLREIGVETGGSNVQFAVNPEDGRLVIIEMNPRVSRSSALASKATGFPIAKVAAKLAVGYTLDEIANDITGGATPASFEPTIDYVVTKIPRFAFEKFPGAEPVLTTSMKSVGEAMAIGRTFAGKPAEGVALARDWPDRPRRGGDRGARRGRRQERHSRGARHPLARRHPQGCAGDAARLSRRRDSFILQDRSLVPRRNSRAIVDTEAEIKSKGLPTTPGTLRRLKAMGFSDARLAKLAGLAVEEVAERRRALDVRPVFKRIDTCAAEFASPTAYMYSTYERAVRRPAGGRGRALGPQQGRDSRRRAEPHRPGHRVRLLLLPCRLRAQGGGLRDHHDQLQSGDRVDRLRHLRPALFRAAHRGGRAGDHRRRARKGKAAWRDRPVRRADAAQACRSLARAHGADPGHVAARHRSRRGPRPLQAAPQYAQAPPAAERHCHEPGRGARNRRGDRLSDPDPSVLRARRPRHGNRARRRPARPLPRPACRRSRSCHPTLRSPTSGRS